MAQQDTAKGRKQIREIDALLAGNDVEALCQYIERGDTSPRARWFVETMRAGEAKTEKAPDPAKVSIQLWISPTVRHALNVKTAREGTTTTTVLRRMVEQYLATPGEAEVDSGTNPSA